MLPKIIKIIIVLSLIYTAVVSYVNRDKQEDVATSEISDVVESTDVRY